MAEVALEITPEERRLGLQRPAGPGARRGRVARLRQRRGRADRAAARGRLHGHLRRRPASRWRGARRRLRRLDRLRLRAARRARGDRVRRAAGASRCPQRARRIACEPRHVAAYSVAVELRGAGQMSRQINNFCAPDTDFADRLIAVEVITPGGNWSSYPPHKHDEDVPGVETALEEIYYFEVADGGFAYQRAYGPGRRHPRGGPLRRPPCCCRPATTARRWPRPATTSTTST